jgi:dTDP-4-dehydrorhamnose reductase
MKVAVIGSNGQLGTDVVFTLSDAGYDVARLTHSDIEISDENSVGSVLNALKPEAIVNTAAMHNVEQCEKDALRAFSINGLGARNLANWCSGADAYFLHVSTDYVFDGAKNSPYLEADPPLPLNVYGVSKLAGEYFVLNECSRSAVLRVSGVYGAHPCRAKGGLNFVRLMLKLATERPELRVVDDEILTPSYSRDIAQQIKALIERRASGLFHGTAQGQCSWFEFAGAIFEITGVQANLQKARPGEFPSKVARPSYSVLENANLKALGSDVMPHWRDGLERYLKEIVVTA